MASSSCPTAIGSSGTPLNPSNIRNSTPNFCTSLPLIPTSFQQTILRTDTPISSIHRSTPNFSPATFSQSEPETEELDSGSRPTPYSAAPMGILPPVRRQRRAYRKQYPGEKKGIAEEMRFVAMRLRNNGSPKSKRRAMSEIDTEDCDEEEEEVMEANDSSGNGEYWQPSMEGFLRYLVDSRLVFNIIERTVDESSDVSYAYFRNTGLERADFISKDLAWLSEQGNDIPEPSNPGVAYSNYLEELGEKNPPLFLCHFYNIYFSHIAGGQVIAKKVCEKLIRGGEGRALEMYRWNGNEEKLLQGVREKLNMLSQHWPRNNKNRCLHDMRKSFRFLDKIVRLIVL
ncbi:unnamed protein product [Cuscuta europaea]|uniref:Inactive heme oxygenase 2, chloroplastic n=1 Tax=Cuscuta europaea TaxID=41803 RepID=A0A9P0YWX2_CUSEU|nr:unnamed protein product [Cuscuta europaea]